MPGENPTGIEVIDGAWDRCGEIVEYVEGLDQWRRSQVNAPTKVVDYRTSDTVSFPFESPSHPPVVRDFLGTMRQLLTNYSFVYGVPVYMYEDVIVNRYAPGQHFGMHPDYYRGSDRVFSAVCYLNTVEDGGATSFVHFGHKVSPVEGRLVIFPANYLFAHSGEPPVSGTKYSAAIWARG